MGLRSRCPDDAATAWLWAAAAVVALSAVADPAGVVGAAVWQAAASPGQAACWTASQRRSIEALLQGISELSQGHDGDGRAASHQPRRLIPQGAWACVLNGAEASSTARQCVRLTPIVRGGAPLRPRPLHLTRIDLPPPACA